MRVLRRAAVYDVRCEGPPSIATRRKCTGCVHDEHRGMCTARNGGTAYPCPCIRTSVPEAAT